MASDDGYITLYHINKHGPGAPHENRGGNPWIRRWLSHPVESGIFLTDKPEGVWKSHNIIGNVHVYKIHKDIVRRSGGLHTLDDVNEVLIPKEIWEDGKKENKIVYLGKMKEDKLTKRLNEIKSVKTHIQTLEDKNINDVVFDLSKKLKTLSDDKTLNLIIKSLDVNVLIALKSKLEKDLENLDKSSFSYIKLKHILDKINECILNDDW